MEQYLGIDELEVGAAYYVYARNFRIAIWDGKAFHGVHYKFGQYFMDQEFHYDQGAPNGTVKPLWKLEETQN